MAMTGFEIQAALLADGLLTKVGGTPDVAVIDTLDTLVSNPALGVAGSGHVTALELKNFVLASVPTQLTETKFFGLDYISSYQNTYRVRTIGTNGSFEFNFMIPDDFVSLVSLVAIGVPTAAGSVGAAKNIDLNSSYALDGQLSTINQESNSLVVDTGTLDNFFNLDLTSVFTSLEAGHRCGYQIDHAAVGGNISYLGTELKYIRNIS